MAELKFKFRDIMNVPHRLNTDRPVTQRSSIKKDFILDTLHSMNDSDLVSYSSFKFKKNITRPTASSSYRNSISHTISSNNNTRNAIYETKDSIQRKSNNHYDLNFTPEIPSITNRKYEFLQIKYSDLLTKNEDNHKQYKNNKFINLLENNQTENTVNSKRSDFRLVADNPHKFKPTKNKFLKELQDFSESLSINYNARRVYNIKPPISVKSTVDTKSLFAFSPTLKKSLITKTSILKSTNEKSTSMLLNKEGKQTQQKKNGYILSKLIINLSKNFGS